MSSHPGRASFVLAAVLLAGGRVSAAAAQPGLVEAASAGDRAAVAALIRQKADVNAPAPDGATALHWAAHNNNLEIAELLTRAGARPSASNKFGVTPLWLASENGSAPMIEKLLAVGADPNIALPSGETPLMTAARAGKEPAVRALLAGGANVAARETSHGQSALMWAAIENHVGVMRALIERGAGVNETTKAGFTPLMFVARQGGIDAAALLLDNGADINAASNDASTPLIIATVRGHVDLAIALLGRGANPNTAGTGYTPLHWASGVWEMPITYDYKFTNHEWAALGGIPSREGKFRLIKALLAHGADPDATMTKMPPRTANSIYPAQLLSGATPFFLAAKAADIELMRLLQASGADTTMRTASGSTPLMGACGGLLRIDYETNTPESEVLRAVQWLMQMGSGVNDTNNAGETPLHAAALAGLDSVVEYLVQKGALVNAKTKAGRTALAMAEKTEVTMQVIVRESTAALLKKLGAE